MFRYQTPQIDLEYTKRKQCLVSCKWKKRAIILYLYHINKACGAFILLMIFIACKYSFRVLACSFFPFQGCGESEFCNLIRFVTETSYAKA